MEVVRVVDAFCVPCDDVRPHAVSADDPSSCFCELCGTSQVLVAPLHVQAMQERPHTPRRIHIRRPAAGHVRLRSAPRPDGNPWEAAQLLDGARLTLEALREQETATAVREELDTVCQTLAAARGMLPERRPSATAIRRAVPTGHPR